MPAWTDRIELIEDIPSTVGAFDDGCYGPLAIIVRNRIKAAPGERKWFTDDSSNLQVGLVSLQQGEKIAPFRYAYPPQQRNRRSDCPQRKRAILFLKSGRLIVTFYGIGDRDVAQRWLENGDMIVHLNGGISIEAITVVEMLEVKTGPYNPNTDKVRFNPQQ